MSPASSKTSKPPVAKPSDSVPVILRARGLRKQFLMGDSVINVLKNVDLSVQQGEFVAIEGRSGSGKSTLLHILGALDTPDVGTVEFDGRVYLEGRQGGWWTQSGLVMSLALFGTLLLVPGPLAWLIGLFVPLPMWGLVGLFGLIAVALTAVILRLWSRYERQQTDLRNRQFGFVFQFYHLLPELNVLENTMLGPMIEHSWGGFMAKKQAIRERAIEVLRSLGLEHRLHHRPNQLSGGERQRVAIARALMNAPKVLFADEPTGNLDAQTGRQIMDVLERLHRDTGQTIVMVTHDRSLAREADRVLLLKDGRLVAAGGD